MIKIKIKSNFRKFKAGDAFEFEMPITVIVGENGCGKSSLIHAIRGKYDFQKFDSGSMFKRDYQKLAENIEVETDIKKFFFYDSVKDDGSNMHNSYDAVEFMNNGGFHTQNLSHGETQRYYLAKLVSEIMKYRETSQEKIMVVLDEFDKGFSLMNQSNVINALYNIAFKHNAQIICISHNYLLIEKIGIVYDMEKRTDVISNDYLAQFKSKD